MMVDFWGGIAGEPAVDQCHGGSGESSPTGVAKGAEPQKPTLFQTVLHSGNDLLNELHTKFNAALSMSEDGGDSDSDDDDDDDVNCASSSTASDVRCSAEHGHGGGVGGRASVLNGKKYDGDDSRSSLANRVTKMASARIANRTRRAARHVASMASSSSSSQSRTHHRRTLPSKARHQSHKTRSCPSDAISSTESASEAEGSDPVRAAAGASTGNSHESSSFSLGNSASEGSLLSWSSGLSCDSQTDEVTAECLHFMKQFVGKLFKDNNSITLEEKSKFGELCQLEPGRLWFSRYVSAQRVHNRNVDESTFYSLVQYFAIVLFECAEADDYAPAKTLMNMCFTYYHESYISDREFLYVYLKDQTIWQSLRFWNAAFFDAVQCERANKPVATREDVEQYSPEEMTNEQEFQENITFGQLGSFTCNMHAFGLNREMCLEFLRKQSIIANLGINQVKMLRENINKMYR